MRRALLLALASTAGAASGQSSAVVAQRLVADYGNAIWSGDLRAWARRLTPGFTGVEAKGRKLSKAGFVMATERRFRGMAFQTFRVDLVSAKIGSGGLLYVQDTKVLGVSTHGGPRASF